MGFALPRQDSATLYEGQGKAIFTQAFADAKTCSTESASLPLAKDKKDKNSDTFGFGGTTSSDLWNPREALQKDTAGTLKSLPEFLEWAQLVAQQGKATSSSGDTAEKQDDKAVDSMDIEGPAAELVKQGMSTPRKSAGGLQRARSSASLGSPTCASSCEDSGDDDAGSE